MGGSSAGRDAADRWLDVNDPEREKQVGRSKRRRRGRTVPDGDGVSVDYETYIRSAAWRRVRRRFVDSKLEKKCAACGKPWGAGDHLHHRSYRHLGRERLMDLVPLCEYDHMLLHQFDRENSGRGLFRNTKRFLRWRRRQLQRE